MKSSTGRFRWLMITLFIVLMALCLGLSMFFIACKGGSADGDDESEKENPSGETTVTVIGVTITGPEVNEVEIGATLTLTATVSTDDGSSYTGSVTWASSDSTIATVSGGTVTGVSEGEANITATAGGVTSETYTVNVVPVTSSEPVYDYNAEESFIVPMTADGATADSTTYAAGDVIVSNTLFTLSSVDGAKYHIGKDYGNLQKDGHVVSFTDMSGTSHNPDQGIESSTDIGPVYNETTEVWDETCLDEIYKIEALEDATVYVYLTLANDSYNSERTGTIYYSINSGTKVSESVSKRNIVVALELTLSAGDVVLIGASNSTTSTDKDTNETTAQNARLWLFGVEAKAKEGGNTGSGSGTTEDPGSSGSSGSDFEEKEGYEWVKTEFDYASAMAQLGTTVTAENNTFGIFSFDTGITMEASDIKTGGNRGFYIQLQGDTNYISFTATGASTSASSVITITDTASGTAYEWTTLSGENSLANNASCDYTISGLPAGKYEIHTSVSAKISNLVVYQYREKGTPESITAVAGVSDFLFGRNVGETDLKLNVTLNYTNGNSDALTMGQYTTDAGNKTWTVGENTVKITYSPEDGSEPFECDVNVYFYQLESVEISDFSMEKSGSNYITHNVQKVYLVGDEVSYDYAAVTATAAYKDNDNTTHTATFVLTSAEVNFALYDENNSGNVDALSQAGTYTVRATVDLSLVSGSAVSETYIIHAVDASGADITAVNVVHPTENTDGTKTEVATYEADSTTGIISVSTINDAITLIKIMGATDAERKYIYVGEGQYWEKIYIDIPNLSLIGSNPTTSDGGTEGDLLGTRSEVTEIVYDAMNGVMDPSGTTTFSTVGSATVTVAEEATGFYAANITFRNYWNTYALYNEAYNTITHDTQADAAYISADRAHFYNVTFTGYHDTLEAENNRQYYENCYIEGRTDYIFGNTATCYFYKCNIHTIGGNSSSNGGYVTAVKGGSMTYGYVFDTCNFTSDLESYYGEGEGKTAVPYEGFAYTTAGTVSLGRTWSTSDMHVAVINSTLDAGYSKTAYGTTGTNPRYTDMSGYKPTAAYLVEYNNSGDGAISTSIEDTCTVLTATEAANYTIANIFAASNGGMSYGSDWNPSTETTITVTVVDNENKTVATIYATDSVTVSNLINAVNARLTDAEVGALYDESGAEITETIKESVTVYITTKEPDPAIKENLYYEYSDFAALTAEEDGTYSLGGIIIDLGTGGTFTSNNNDNKWYVLTGTTTFTLQVKAGTSVDWWDYQSGNLALTANGEAVTLAQYTTSSECLYRYRASVDSELVFSVAADKNEAYIKYIAVNVAYTEDTTINLYDYSGTIQKDYGYYKGIFVDATYVDQNDTSSAAKFGNTNGSWLQFNIGTILIFNVGEGAAVTASFYNANTEETTYTSIDVTDGVCTITALASTYIASITVSYAS